MYKTIKNLTAIFLLTPIIASAGTDDTLSEGADILSGWGQGKLGYMLASEVMVVGTAYAVIRQTFWHLPIAFGVAIALIYGIDFIDSMHTMTA